MTITSQGHTGRKTYERDGTDRISFGALLIIIAIIYLTTPKILGAINTFFHDFQLVQIFDDFKWFAPSTTHPVVYGAAQKFCYLFGVVQIGILALKFAKRALIQAKAETASGIVFWFGLGYILGLLEQAGLSWASFLAYLIILVGASIIMRSVILLFFYRDER